MICVLLLHFFPLLFFAAAMVTSCWIPGDGAPFPLFAYVRLEAPAGRQEGHRNPQGLKSSKLVATRRFYLGSGVSTAEDSAEL